ncbi:MAG TPA: DNA replication and repair protein RecF [Candidatus Saccharimonadales bacterium]|nr:DNA replication and repair protein RecF [Candidatus Saccharimonadales bacterium]
MLNTIRVQNFRSYKDDSFEFDDSVNIIVGPNASGKTNLLEAILMICAGKSYRAKDQETIKYGRPWARIEAYTPNANRILKLINNPAGSVEKNLTINDQISRRITQPKQLAVVLFEPNHLQLFLRGPEARRDYLDDLLEQTVVGYGSLRQQYKRALAQRNRLLKQHPTDVRQQLFAWNVRLSELGGHIVTERQKLVATIDQKLPKLYNKLANSRAKVRASYDSKVPLNQYSSQFLHKLDASVELDLERGFTAYGPHRDDLKITFAGHDIQDSASRGEIRTLLLALKIIELDIVEKRYEQRPILLLDDVFSELDGARRRALTNFLQDYQTFITTTDADVVVQHFTGNSRIIPLVK